MGSAAAPELWRLSAARAAGLIAAGELTSEALTAACLRRIEQREPRVRAWAHLDPHAALAQARERDGQPPRGPLHGVPVGVKDIIDTADLPTECGTPIHAGRRPARDARCVARLREAGAVVLGKTVTTELATYAPAATRNPVDLERTPGGSSSGSAAAVADAMVPLALGSQTAGSTIRPAAFCGVLGLKPTRGAIDPEGVKRLSARLDTLGLFARTVDDLELLLGVLVDAAPPPAPAVASPHAQGPPAFAFARTPWWESADRDGRRAVESSAARLAAGSARVRELELPAAFGPLAEDHRRLMAHDLARELAWEHERHADLLSDLLRDEIAVGLATTDAEADAIAARGAACRDELAALLGPGEVLLVPAAVGEPPALADRGTGDPLFCRAWTLLGVPALAVPGPTGEHALPVGVQLVGTAGGERALLHAGAWALDALG
jgi:Asp-tRNA(Asn)/Glu-tRNA(Gln) amidotransferase A subunit family amidase